MIETRSNEMKIEREKGYVWCLVGMSMRSAIWNQFWGPKMAAKWVPKCSKIGPETALKGNSHSKIKKEGAKFARGAAPELRGRVPTVRPSHFWTPNWSQNRPGSLQKSIWKATSKQSRFRERFGTDFWSIFEPLEANSWSNLEALTCKVNVTLDKTEFFRNYVKTKCFWKKIG